MLERVVEKSRTAQELQDGFTNKIDTLDVCMGLLGLGGQEPHHYLQELKKQLHAIRATIGHLRSQLEEGRRSLEQTMSVLPSLIALNTRLGHMRDNLPARLPSLLQHQQLHRPKPDLSNIVNAAAGGAVDAGSKLSKQDSATVGGAVVEAVKASAQFQYITMDEFEEVPKYIRGRLQYEQVNKVVDDLNKALAAKYSLLRKTRSKLSLPDMKLVNVLKSQNSVATKGRMFVCGDDLKRWCDVKMDTSTRTVLTVLRTAKKCQEIRGPAPLIRYAACADAY